MRALLLVLALAVLFSVPCAAVDTEELKYALPEDAAGLLQEVDFTDTDPQRGFTALFQQAVQVLRKGLKASVTSAFFMTAVCMLVSLLEGFAKSAGVNLPARAGELSGATAILSLALGQNGALLELCRQAVSNLDRFTKVLCGVFAAASAAAGKPVSAAATAGAAMLFSDLLFQLTLKVFLPGVTLYLLLLYGSVICGNGTLRQAAGVEKWAVTAFFRVFLTVYFAYLTFTGLVSGSADAAAVKTAQTLSSTVPLVGSVIAGASETILTGGALLRSSVGLAGFLGAAAICLVPFVQGLCHLLVFRVLSVLAAGFSEGGCKTMLDGLWSAYAMLIGMLAACCAVQFITIAVSMLVTGT